MKLIVVVGGVLSGVGKGVASASIGKILQEYGFSVTIIKIDPYINYDAGTLRPTEHGEVWVTDDGGEIDQDLGNYERFLGIDIPKRNNITTGQIYKAIIDRERNGEYLGQTVQFIPHVPEEIKRRIMEAGQGFDFVIVEIGGTIGDHENVPYLFATKSLEIELGKDNVSHILVSYLPVPFNVGEMKTKPTQQAIRLLNQQGLNPDFVLCRSTQALDNVRKKKIEVYANISADHIISAPDIRTIYRAPLNFENEGLGKKLLKKFKVEPKRLPDWSSWKQWVDAIESPLRKINVAMVGKYVDIGDFSLADSYISVNQALEHAGASCNVGVNISWVDSKIFEKTSENLKKLKEFDGIIVPGGFGSSGIEGKISAITYARENDVPFLGLCYGLQLAVVEFARFSNLAGANTTEVNPDTKYPVIDILPTQKELIEKKKYGATMRLGAYAAVLNEDSKVLELYKQTGRLEKDTKRVEKMLSSHEEKFRLGLCINAGKNIILERHRHRYEVSPKFINILEKNGLVFSGVHIREDGTKLMEFIELPNHKYFIATQAHPEFKSRIGDPAPLFWGFVRACA